MTKAWNLDLQAIEADHDGVFVDYRDSGVSEPCGAKFKVHSDTVQHWIAAHKLHYEKEKTEYDEKSGSATLKVKKNSTSKVNRLVITFYDSGVIIAQGESSLTWAFVHVQLMKQSNVDTLGHALATAGISAGNVENFHGPEAILSNFNRDDVIFNTTKYPSTENAYQAEKLIFHKMPGDAITNISTEENPYRVKELGNEIGTCNDWQYTKVDRMFKIVSARLDQSPTFREYLLATEGKKLIHSVDDKDWGQIAGKGANAMGLLLEALRATIRTRFPSLAIQNKRDNADATARATATATPQTPPPDLGSGSQNEQQEKLQLLITQEADDIITVTNHKEGVNQDPTSDQLTPASPVTNMAEGTLPTSLEKKGTPFVTRMKSMLSNTWGSSGSPREMHDRGQISRQLSALENSYTSLFDTSTTILDQQKDAYKQLEKDQKQSGETLSALKCDLATFARDMKQEMADMKKAINEIRGELQKLPPRAGEPLQQKACLSESLATDLKSQMEEITNLLCQHRAQCPSCEEKELHVQRRPNIPKDPSKKEGSDTSKKARDTSVAGKHPSETKPLPKPHRQHANNEGKAGEGGAATGLSTDNGPQPGRPEPNTKSQETEI